MLKCWCVCILGLMFVVMMAYGQPYPTGSGSTPTTYSTGGVDLPDRELEERIRGFFSNLASSVPTAFEDFLKGGPLGASLDAAKIGELRSQFDVAKQQLGTYRSQEKIDSKFVGKDVVVARYLYKGEFSPMVWTITFYRTTTSGTSTPSWYVISLRFDTDIEHTAATL